MAGNLRIIRVSDMKPTLKYCLWLQGYLAALEAEIVPIGEDHKKRIVDLLREALNKELAGKVDAT